MKKLLTLLTSIVLVGCVQGNCRSQQPEKSSEALNTAAVKAATGAMSRVKIFKYDGSLQCGQGAKVALADMQKDLGTIQVFSSENKPDNLMHIQACGTPTGHANVFEIERSDLDAAKKKGFREWTAE